MGGGSEVPQITDCLTPQTRAGDGAIARECAGVRRCAVRFIVIKGNESLVSKMTVDDRAASEKRNKKKSAENHKAGCKVERSAWNLVFRGGRYIRKGMGGSNGGLDEP